MPRNLGNWVSATKMHQTSSKLAQLIEEKSLNLLPNTEMSSDGQIQLFTLLSLLKEHRDFPFEVAK